MAEAEYTPFQSEPDAVPVRLIVRRVKPTPGSQLALFASYSYHAFITDRDGDALELESDHRRHAEIENAIRRPQVWCGTQPSALGTLRCQRRLAGRYRCWPTTWPLDRTHRSGRAGWQLPRPSAGVSSPWPDGSPAQRGVSPCICHGAGPGKTSSATPWPGCGQCPLPS